MCRMIATKNYSSVLFVLGFNLFLLITCFNKFVVSEKGTNETRLNKLTFSGNNHLPDLVLDDHEKKSNNFEGISFLAASPTLAPTAVSANIFYLDKYYFSGSTIYSYGTLSSASNHYITIALWVNATSMSSTQYLATTGRSSSTLTGEMMFAISSGGTLKFWEYDGSNYGIFAEGATALKANKRYHVAVVKSLDTGYIYVNGVLDSNYTTANIVSNPHSFLNFGGDPRDLVDYFKGWIDTITIYNYAMSASEILNLYTTPTVAPTNAPTAAPTTISPSLIPTTTPTAAPTTSSPSLIPTTTPTWAPTTIAPTRSPTTSSPTRPPTFAPTFAPSVLPTIAPSTIAPTRSPTTYTPTAPPTRSPTVQPTYAPSYIADTYKITTFAGNGLATYSSSYDNVAATSGAFYYLYCTTMDTSGNLYVSDQNKLIRKISASTNIISTFGGSVSISTVVDNVAATSSVISEPSGIWMDSANKYLYIAETSNQRIRRINMATNIITTFAGTGSQSYSGDGGQATSATFNWPRWVDGDSIGNIYITDTFNNYIRKVSTTTGIITLFAGSGSSTSDNVPATSASIYHPGATACDTNGHVYIAPDAYKIRKVAYSTNIITTIAGTGSSGSSGDGGPATSATISTVMGLFLYSNNLYLADSSNHKIRVVDLSTGIITLLAGTGTGSFSGDGGYATAATLYSATHAYVTSTGDVYISDRSNQRVRKLYSVAPTAAPSFAPSYAPNYIYPTSQPTCHPTCQPSSQPSSQPTRQPSRQPTAQPTAQPTRKPTSQPSRQPTTQPTSQPTRRPTSQPTGQPTRQPTAQPTRQPTSQPTGQPTRQPTAQPTSQPTTQPTSQPTRQPTAQPTSQPTRQPTAQPTRQPTAQPTGAPSHTIYEYPPTAATSNPFTISGSSGAGTYVMSYGSAYSVSSSSSIIYDAFDRSSSTFFHTKTTYSNYYGVYQGNITTTTVNGTSYAGDYVQLKLPMYVYLTKFSMQGRQLVSAYRMPRKFVVLGSGDCSSWNLVVAFWSVTDWSDAVKTFTVSSVKASYACYRVVAMRMGNVDVSTGSYTLDSFNIAEWLLYGYPDAYPTGQPTTQPTGQPSRQPTGQPSVQPTIHPTCQPTCQPSRQPSIQPTSRPSRQPTSQPTVRPSSQPSRNPSAQPTNQPSSQPTRQPTSHPTSQPSRCPSIYPTSQPTIVPTTIPSALPTTTPTNPSSSPTGEPSSAIPTAMPTNPTSVPSALPSFVPSSLPTSYPTEPSSQPSSSPTSGPSLAPWAFPSSKPSAAPSSHPSTFPSKVPLSGPSGVPTNIPSSKPTHQPSSIPSSSPSLTPTSHPTSIPSVFPSSSPTVIPLAQPTAQPTVVPSNYPSSVPTASPTNQPSAFPSTIPSVSPSIPPSVQPTSTPSSAPSSSPSIIPTGIPSGLPISQPTARPTLSPSLVPTVVPSRQPTSGPSSIPSGQPSTVPTSNPTGPPTVHPTCHPSSQPSSYPSAKPSTFPTSQPLSFPTTIPTLAPTISPSARPSSYPTTIPSVRPSVTPTVQPSSMPSVSPTIVPTSCPTNKPSSQPSTFPSAKPVSGPTSQPSGIPSAFPTIIPSAIPSVQPTSSPTSQPSSDPTSNPTSLPSRHPTSTPSNNPTSQPSSRPSAIPTTSPTASPSKQPTALPTSIPSVNPSNQPTVVPTSVPTIIPITNPTSQPSSNPSSKPSTEPSCLPTAIPSTHPTTNPSSKPSSQPSIQPSSHPTCSPSGSPTSFPSALPSSTPSVHPTVFPSSKPSSAPSLSPSVIPSTHPTALPTLSPSAVPTIGPSGFPSSQPSSRPSSAPSALPSSEPSNAPTSKPSFSPTSQPSSLPSTAPSCLPTNIPTSDPTVIPTKSPLSDPTSQPSRQPTVCPSSIPSLSPSTTPTSQPSSYPSPRPSNAPSNQPTSFPSTHPTVSPTSIPSSQPSTHPSSLPTIPPSPQPTSHPSDNPSSKPTTNPSAFPTGLPSTHPSSMPSCIPSAIPTRFPSSVPTIIPTLSPSSVPSAQPSNCPSKNPSSIPSVNPTSFPTIQPTSLPTAPPSPSPSRVPSSFPTSSPTISPTNSPTIRPTTNPTSFPSGKPSSEPSASPSRCPTNTPSNQPTVQPTNSPTLQPTCDPTALPTAAPSSAPSYGPTVVPSSQPSNSPTNIPSGHPTSPPSGIPSNQPLACPTAYPSALPSTDPTSYPTVSPSIAPSVVPSSQPSCSPSVIPSNVPSVTPTEVPTNIPSVIPTSRPSQSPSGVPSGSPTASPSSEPTSPPTSNPSTNPTITPSTMPSASPSSDPTQHPSSCPTSRPSSFPSTHPTFIPTLKPTLAPSSHPSSYPSNTPTSMPSSYPSASPSNCPTRKPTSSPSSAPSVVPSTIPSSLPTSSPSTNPTNVPTGKPSMIPSAAPSSLPTIAPTSAPTSRPSATPTLRPSSKPSSNPTPSPSNVPTGFPTSQPSAKPSGIPTTLPSTNPSCKPSSEPSVIPTVNPSTQPSSCPSITPTGMPSLCPSMKPVGIPSSIPSIRPTLQPSLAPSSRPSNQPTSQPLTIPSAQPTQQPATCPTGQPTQQPSTQPTRRPTIQPTSQPLNQPTSQPSFQPTNQPSRQPSVEPTTLPSAQPSIQPSVQPTIQPTLQPYSKPSSEPSCQPIGSPSSQPSNQPSRQPSSKPSVNLSSSRTSAPSAQVVTVVVSNIPLVSTITINDINTSFVTVVVPFKNSALLSGVVYCNAFVSSSSVPLASLFSLVAGGTQRSYQVGAQQVTMTLTGLISMKSYSIYCAVATSVGSVSNATTIRQTQRNFTTICCRSISFSSYPSYLYNSETLYTSSSSNIYTYKLSSLPETSLTVTPVLMGLESDNSYSVERTSFLPAYQNWQGSSTSQSLSTSFKLLPNSTLSASKSYIVKLILSGTDASRYLQQVSVKLVILETQNDPPIPSLKLVQMSDSGDALYMVFDSSTNYANILESSWFCSRLWQFTGSGSTSCSWINQTTIYAQLSGSSLIPGEMVTLIGGNVAASCTYTQSCDSYGTTASISIAITAPSNPIHPVVGLVSLAEYTLCSNVTLDASASTGSGGRDWRSIDWQVLVSDGSDALSVTQHLQQYFSSTASLASTITLPRKLFGNDTYYISLTLTNFLGQSSSETTFFLYGSDGNMPMVKIGGSSSLSIKASSSITLYGYTEVSSCSKTTGITYEWFVKDITGSSTGSGVITKWKSSSKNPWIFSLAGYCLTAGNRYSIIFQATSNAKNSVDGTSYELSTSTSVIVNVLSGNVHAVVAGASVRYISTSTTLDASASYDDNTNVTTALTYLWTCTYGSGEKYGTSCSDDIGWNKLVKTNSSTLAVFYDKLNENTQYLFTVTVTSQIGTIRSDSSTVTIYKLASSNEVDIAITGTTTVVNYGSACIINSNVTSPKDISVVWKALINDKEQSTIAIVNLRNGAASSGINVPLFLSSVTYPIGSTLQLRLGILDEQMYSEIKVRVNGSPRGGKATTSPTYGTALSTLFSIVTSNWQDDATDLPLSYDFRYSADGHTTMLSIQSRCVYSSVSSYLPVGAQSYDYKVYLYIRAYDIYLAEAELISNVTVTNAVITDYESTLNNMLVSANVLQNADQQVVVLNSVSSTMNAISCSGAEAQTCRSLNRNPCLLTAHTCSSCLSGYVGVSGDSNTLCQNSSSKGEIGSVCNDDADCLYQKCSDEKLCVYPYKACPIYDGAECANRGTCKYTISGKEVSSCTVDITACTATCHCGYNYSGNACQYSVADLLKRGAARASMCSKLKTALKLNDISTAQISKFVTSLLSAYDPTEVTVSEGMDACKDVLDYILHTSVVSDDSTGVASSFLDMTKANTSAVFISMLSKLLTPSSNSSASFSTSIDNSTSSFVHAALIGMTYGQNDIEITSNNLKMRLSKSLVTNVTGISVPLTAEEIAYGKSPISIEFINNSTTNCSDSSGYASLSVGAYTSSPYNMSQTNLTTSLLRSESVYYGGRMGSGGKVKSTSSDTWKSQLSRNVSYYLSFPFIEPQQFNSTPPDYVRNYDEKLNIELANRTIPSCSQYVSMGNSNEVQSLSCSSCEISYYTNYSVVFACYDITQLCYNVDLAVHDTVSDHTLSLSNEDRELTIGVDDWYYTIPTQTDAVNSVYQVAALTVSVLDEIESVLSDNPFDINPEQYKGIIAFVCALVFVTFTGMGLFYRWDRIDREQLIFLDEGKPHDAALTFKQGDDESDAKTILKRLLLLIKHSMPLDIDEINDMSLLYRYFIYPFTEHHDILLPIGKPSLSETRLIRWTTFCLMFYFAMFFDTILFKLLFNDDGSCEKELWEDDCNNHGTNSILKQPTCIWENNECAFREAPSTIMFTVITSCVTMLFCVPLNMLYEYLLGEICCKRPDFSTIGWNTMYWVGVASYEAQSASWYAHEYLAEVENKKEDDKSEESAEETPQLATVKSFRQLSKRNTSQFNTLDRQDAHSVDSHSIESHDHENHDHQDLQALTELTYCDSISIRDEMQIILSKARPYFDHPRAQLKRVDVWGTVRLFSVTGVVVTLQRLFKVFKMSKNIEKRDAERIFPRLYARVKKARKAAKSILEGLGFGTEEEEDGEDSEDDGKDNVPGEVEDTEDLETINLNQALLQHFILEQLPPFQRYALKHNCFVNDYTSPEKVPVLQWIAAWAFIILSMGFYIYWVFAWCTHQGNATFKAWGNVLLGDLLQDIFLIQVCKIYIVYVAAQSAILARLLVIRSTLETIAHDIYYNVRECQTEEEKLQVPPDVVDVALVQHFSPACRASRSRHICNLPAAWLLQHVNDLDIHHCRKPPYKVQFSLATFVLMSVPVLLMVISEEMAESAFEYIYSFAITTLYGGLTYFILTAPQTTIITIAVVGTVWITYSLVQYFYVKTKEVRYIELARDSSLRSSLAGSRSSSMNESRFAARRREILLNLSQWLTARRKELRNASFILRNTVVAREIKQRHKLIWLNMNNCRLKTEKAWLYQRKLMHSMSFRSMVSDSDGNQLDSVLHSLPEEINTIITNEQSLITKSLQKPTYSYFYLDRFETDMQNEFAAIHTPKESPEKAHNNVHGLPHVKIHKRDPFQPLEVIKDPSLLKNRRQYDYIFQHSQCSDVNESILRVMLLRFWTDRQVQRKIQSMSAIMKVDFSLTLMKNLLQVVQDYLELSNVETIGRVDYDAVDNDNIFEYVVENIAQKDFWTFKENSLSLQSLKVTHKQGVRMLDTFLQVYEPVSDDSLEENGEDENVSSVGSSKASNDGSNDANKSQWAYELFEYWFQVLTFTSSNGLFSINLNQMILFLKFVGLKKSSKLAVKIATAIDDINDDDDSISNVSSSSQYDESDNKRRSVSNYDVFDYSVFDEKVDDTIEYEFIKVSQESPSKSQDNNMDTSIDIDVISNSTDTHEL